jgi:hypothetical protein
MDARLVEATKGIGRYWFEIVSVPQEDTSKD